MTTQSCPICHHHCKIDEGQYGFCRVRKIENGKNICGNYGLLASLALDPIKKKPLARFHPGKMILSAGNFGCNLRCPFCQNFQLSQHSVEEYRMQYVSPKMLVQKAVELKETANNLGVAFTYNEPILSYEYIIATGRLLKKAELKTVVVSNGNFSAEIAEKLAPWVDAYNIDLKGFTEEYYRKMGGDLKTVLKFIKIAAKNAHVELTKLIVPGENDSLEEMEAQATWIAENTSKETVLHVSRFFPAWNMINKNPTSVSRVYELAEIARKQLKYVYTGNC